MSEIAMVSARKNRLNYAASRGLRGAKTAIELQNSPGKFLSAVQIGITLIGILTGIYSGDKIAKDLVGIITRFPMLAPYAETISITVVLIIITFFSLVLGELVPKRIGLTYPESIARMVALPMKIISVITAPFIWLLTRTTDLLLRLFPVRRGEADKVTEEEIKAIIREGTEEGEIQRIEQDIVNRVFSVGDRTVSSLMTSRKKMAALDIHETREGLKAIVQQTLHNYYPIYDPEEQDFVGVVSLKQLFAEIEKDDFDLQNVIAEPSYIAEGSSAYQALEQFKSSRIHYALVIDEYGTTQGIITISDILEALVGDVSEFYDEEFVLVQRDEKTWLIDGQYPLADFFTRFGMEDRIRDYEVNTIGGLIMVELGRIPRPGEKLLWEPFEFEIIDMDGPAIDKVMIVKQ